MSETDDGGLLLIPGILLIRMTTTLDLSNNLWFDCTEQKTQIKNNECSAFIILQMGR